MNGFDEIVRLGCQKIVEIVGRESILDRAAGISEMIKTAPIGEGRLLRASMQATRSPRQVIEIV